MTPSPPADLLRHWDLVPDGMPWRGWTSAVWPVRGPGGQRWALKVPEDRTIATGEAAALRAWAAHPGSSAHVVQLIGEQDGALLLQRLDDAQPLEQHADPAAADQVLAECLAALTGIPAPPGIPALAGEVARMRQSIETHWRESPALVERHLVERALSTLDEFHTDLLETGPGELTLLHYDLHYLNVLRTLPADGARWVAIDPLPHAGLPEIEVVPALRNRFADAGAGGEPERGLRRRLALLAEAAGADAPRAAAIAQAVAVDNLLWLLPREPGHLFVPPYSLLAHW